MKRLPPPHSRQKLRYAIVGFAVVSILSTAVPIQAQEQPHVADSVAVAMRRGQHEYALRLLAARHHTDSATDRVRTALCNLALGNAQTADSLLAIADPSGFRIEYRDYWRALAAFQLGDYDRAAREFDVLVNRAKAPARDSASVWSLRAALAANDSLLIDKSIARLTAHTDELAAPGLLWQMRRDTTQWRQAWTRLSEQYPATDEARIGAVVADSLGWVPSGEEWVYLARLYEKNNDVLAATRAWNGAIADPTISDRHDYARYHAARLLVNNRDYPPAVAHIQTLLGNEDAQEWWPRALRLFASLERKRDRETRSRQIESEFIERYPTHDEVPDAMWQIAMSYERTRNFDQAIDAYERLAQAFPRLESADDARWRVGLILYRQRHFTRAHRQFERIARETPHWIIQDQATFWTGKALYANGEYERARLTWDRAAAYSPRSYYATVSALVANRPVTPPEDENPSPREPVRRPHEWDGYNEAAWLATLGEWRWARAVLQTRTSGSAKTVAEREALADAFEALGDYPMALRWRWRAMWGRITEDRYHELPPDLLRRIWPDFYRDQVRIAANEHDLDPAIVWAIIRQESVFDPDVTSFADARGLMQIIPRTGTALARELRITDFDAADLYEPELNIRLGTHYIKQLMDQFGNKVDLMAAGYNAGPSNVARWKRAAGDDFDLYRELITYAETRKYVKLVLRNYLVYRALYPDRFEDRPTDPRGGS